MARQDVLTPKEEAFVAEYVKNGNNGVQAALKAYDTDNYKSASVISTENLDKLRVKTSIQKAMLALGIDDNYLSKVLQEGLKATRPVIKGDKVFTVEDYAVRHKYLDTAHKLTGNYAPEKIETDSKSEIVVRIEENTELKDVLEGQVVDETITTLADETSSNA